MAGDRSQNMATIRSAEIEGHTANLYHELRGTTRQRVRSSTEFFTIRTYYDGARREQPYQEPRGTDYQKDPPFREIRGVPTRSYWNAYDTERNGFMAAVALHRGVRRR